MLTVSLIFSFALLQAKCFCSERNSSIALQSETTADCDEPLLLTSFLKPSSKASVKEAQDKAYVKPFAGNLKSYSGFFTVNETYKSNLFFWFFESEKKPTTAPLLLWLHGGPGHSTLMSLFGENGPYRVEKGEVKLAPYSWTAEHNVLYIENPIGTGYSYAEKSQGYTKTVDDAAENLYKALIQFFQLFPDLKKNKFYLTGQSYAGKYIPTLASIIRNKNEDKKTEIKINLKGLFIGAGFIDPQNQLHFSDYFYEHGIFNTEERNLMIKEENEAKGAMKLEQYKKAQKHLNKIKSKLVRCGYKQPFIDVLNPRYDFTHFDEAKKFLQKDSTRKELHVGSRKFMDKRQICWHHSADYLSSVSAELSEVVKYYKVLLYSGQFDMVVPPVQVENVIASMSWDGVQRFFNTVTYEKFYIGSELAGYMKAYKNLIQVMVRRANHLIIRSQPKWMSGLISWFTSLS